MVVLLGPGEWWSYWGPVSGGLTGARWVVVLLGPGEWWSYWGPVSGGPTGAR